MYNLIRADLFKLRKSLALRIILGITTFSAIIMLVMAYLIPQGKIDPSMFGIGFMFSDINMVSILGAVLAGVFISGDFDNKMIHDAIASGHSRLTVIISKTIVFFTAILIILLPYIIVTVIALISGNDYDMGTIGVALLHMMTEDTSVLFSASEIGKLVIIIITLLVVYMAQLSICVPVSFVFKNPILVVAGYYVFTILVAQIAGLSSDTIIYKVAAFTPYGGHYAFLTLDTEIGRLIKAVCASLGFIILMIFITYRAFRRAEVK
ncbi:MAG: ABC transporter permease [Vallitaleaceae bacterium]|jgi:ABC-2 type transport system permease protein|nr:ABC transporter permease [Vallitaleaceae bacterium]